MRPKKQTQADLEVERLLSAETDDERSSPRIKARDEEDPRGGGAEAGGEEAGSLYEQIKDEVKISLKLALPVSASAVVAYTATLIATGMIGRLGKEGLSAYTLARSFYHIVGLSLIMGLACGLEIIGGQSYGARSYKVVGHTLQRAILVNIAACIPAVILSCFGEKVLQILGQDPDISHLAWQYLIRAIPSLWAGSVVQSMIKYFSCMGQVWGLALGATIQTLFTPLWNWLFIFKLERGLQGAAYAYDLVLTTDAVFYILGAWILGRYIQGPNERTWSGFSKAALSGWGHYLSMAVPAAAMICLEWWVYEVAIMITGQQRGDDAQVQLATMGLCFNLRATAYMLGQGVSVATSTRVSNLLGAGKGDRARLSMRVNCMIMATFSIILALLIVVRPEAWPRLLTTDEEVIRTVADMAVYLAIGIMWDGIGAVGASILRGAGRPFVGVVVTLLTYWILGLPLGALLGLHHGMGARGMWIALMVAAISNACLLVAIISQLCMKTEIERAKHLVRAALPRTDHQWSSEHETGL